MNKNTKSSEEYYHVLFYLLRPYKLLRTWSIANRKLLPFFHGDNRYRYRLESAMLIDKLPEVKKVTVLEIRAIFSEVLTGNLEWGYHGSDGVKRMSQYAAEALDDLGLSWGLSKEEKEELKAFEIYGYISQHHK